MNLFLLAQSSPVDAADLADANAQEILAWVVGALVLAVTGLFGLFLKVISDHKKELREVQASCKEERDKLEKDKDVLQDRLLRYASKTNEVLASMMTSEDI